MELQCVNKWCKYANTIYCRENCGSFVKEGTQLKNINHSLLHQEEMAVCTYHDNKLLANGKVNDVLKKVVEYNDKVIKEAHFDGCGHTFCIWID